MEKDGERWRKKKRGKLGCCYEQSRGKGKFEGRRERDSESPKEAVSK
jgi:hypothetical protein